MFEVSVVQKIIFIKRWVKVEAIMQTIYYLIDYLYNNRCFKISEFITSSTSIARPLLFIVLIQIRRYNKIDRRARSDDSRLNSAQNAKIKEKPQKPCLYSNHYVYSICVRVLRWDKFSWYTSLFGKVLLCSNFHITILFIYTIIFGTIHVETSICAYRRRANL